jgi:hypothetical protein
MFVLAAVWVYARFAEEPVAEPKLGPDPTIAHHDNLQLFVATPGMNLGRIHIRTGPGGEYAIVETIPRGAPLTCIGRTTDSTGEWWIVLANKRGYVKETVVSPTIVGGK